MTVSIFVVLEFLLDIKAQRAKAITGLVSIFVVLEFLLDFRSEDRQGFSSMFQSLLY